MNKEIIIYSFLVAFGFILFSKLLRKNDDSFKRQYKEIISSEKYKVKGQYD
jgi:hypothetical protein